MTFTTETLEAFADRLGSWGARLLAWLLEAGRAARLWPEIKTQVCAAERGLAGLIVLLALKRLAPPSPVRTIRRRVAHAPPNGFRRHVVTDHRRTLVRFVLPKARGLIPRVRRLLAVLGALSTHVEKAVRRVATLPPASVLLAVAPPDQSCLAQTAAQPVCTDTS